MESGKIHSGAHLNEALGRVAAAAAAAKRAGRAHVDTRSGSRRPRHPGCVVGRYACAYTLFEAVRYRYQ